MPWHPAQAILSMEGTGELHWNQNPGMAVIYTAGPFPKQKCNGHGREKAVHPRAIKKENTLLI